jgi:hypothetical protein
MFLAALEAAVVGDADSPGYRRTPPESPLDDRIVAALAEANGPMPFPVLRERCRVRAATLYQRLAALSAADRIVKTDTGYRLAGG